jgi:hypothetical protein
MSVTSTPSGIPSIALVRQEINVAKRTEAQQQAAADKQREIQNSNDAADSELQAQQVQQSQASPNSSESSRQRDSAERGDRDRVDFHA